MFSLLLRYRTEFLSSDGGMWLVLIDALLIIPLILAAFFYPLEVLMGVGGVMLATVGGYEGYLFWRRRRRLRADHT
jgi:hypothetical protein